MNVKHATDHSLSHVYEDCVRAIAAMPTNPKVREYIDLMDAIAFEQQARQRKRLWRAGLLAVHDPLTVPFFKTTRDGLVYRYRHQVVNRPTVALSSAFCLGWLKLHG